MPMLHKFSYRPVGATDPRRRPGALCRRAGRHRGRGERGRRRGYRRSGRDRHRRDTRRWSMRAPRSPTARRRSMPRRPATSSSKARSRRPASTASGTAPPRSSPSTRARAGRTRRRWKRAPATPATTHRTGRITLTCTTQMPHLMRTAIADLLGMRESDLRVIAPDVGGGFGQKMSLCAEYVALVWLARKLKSIGRLDRGPAREPDRQFPFARPVHRAGRRLRQGRQAAGAARRHRLECRRLFLLSHHLRRRAADGDGGDAGALRRAAVSSAGRAACSPTPAPWRPIAACRGRSSRSRWNG